MGFQVRIGLQEKIIIIAGILLVLVISVLVLISAARIQQILAQSVAASTASSDESRPDSTLSTSQVSGPLPWQPNSPYFFLTQVGHKIRTWHGRADACMLHAWL